MNRFLDLLAKVLFVLGGVLLFVAGGMLLFEKIDRPGVTIEQPVRKLDGVVAGKEITLRFPIKNSWFRDAEVVGLGTC